MKLFTIKCGIRVTIGNTNGLAEVAAVAGTTLVQIPAFTHFLSDSICRRNDAVPALLAVSGAA